MIRYLADNEKKKSEVLYREAFYEDKDEFVEYYYSYVTKNNKIMVLEQEGDICSMLHLNPYQLSVNGQKTDAYYYVAVATKKNCRHQGMMRKLLVQSLNDIQKEGHPFAYLMPADKAIYEPFDFRIVYEQKQIEVPAVPELANEMLSERFDVFTMRDDWYVERIKEEARICEGDPPSEIVPYIMMRITNVVNMLELLRSEKPLRVVLVVEDSIVEENNGTFLWEISELESRCKKIQNSTEGIQVTIADLTEFVFGKRNIRGLEDIKVLSRICINEIV